MSLSVGKRTKSAGDQILFSLTVSLQRNIVQYEEEDIVLKKLSSFTDSPNDVQLTHRPKAYLSLALLFKQCCSLNRPIWKLLTW